MSPAPHLAPAQAITFGTTARIVVNEAAKGLRVAWAYRASQVAALLTSVGTYLVIQYFIGGGRIVDALVAQTAPGLFAYVVVFVANLRLVAGILEERNSGTLEQAHLSPLPAWQLALGRLAAVMIEAVAIATVAVGGVLIIRAVDYPLNAAVLVPVSLTLVGLAAFALLLGAASFTFPGIGAVVHVLGGIVLLLNGTVMPPELFPRWLEILAKTVPSTLGVSAMRGMLTDGQSLRGLWQSGGLGWLLAHTVALAVVGVAAYQLQIRRARRDGRLGPA